MKQKQIWMALVTDENEVVFSKACSSERKAENAIVKHLQKEEEFDGKDFNDACFWIGEKDLRLNLTVFPMGPDEFGDVKLSSPLSIASPPDEKGLFRVVYVIDVSASNSKDAAEYVYRIMTDPDSLPPVLEVIDNKGNVIKIDLSERNPKAQGKTS